MQSTSPTAAESALPRFAVFIALLSSMMALTALSIDIMLPAFPEFRSDFGLTGANPEQLLITVYLAGFAVGQLAAGPLSDRFGRKPVIIVGMAIYLASAIWAIFASSFEMLLLARVVQGAANASPRVVTIALVRDIYGGRRMAEVMSFVMMVFTIAPIVAPMIGAGILLVGGWQWIFVFLALFCMASMIGVAVLLPETNPVENRRPMSAASLLKACQHVLTTPQTLGYTLASGLLFGAVMGYVNSAQQVFADVYGIGALFTLLFGVVSCALGLAAFLNIRLVMRMGMRRMSHAALLGFVVVGAAHLLSDRVFGPAPVAVFVTFLALNLFCFGLCMPNFNALAMEPMGHIAGTASSFVGATTTGMSALLGWFVGQRYDVTADPLIEGFLLYGVIALVVVFATERGKLFRVGAGA